MYSVIAKFLYHVLCGMLTLMAHGMIVIAVGELIVHLSGYRVVVLYVPCNGP